MRDCWQAGRHGYTAPAVVVGILMSVCLVAQLVAGFRLDAAVSLLDGLQGVPGGYFALLLALGVAAFAAVSACCILVYGAYDRALDQRTKTPIAPFGETLRSGFVKIFMLLVGCWLLWFIAHLPGAFDDDTAWQLIIWHNPASWTNHHPWLTTVIYGLFIDAGIALGSSGIGLIAHNALTLLLTAASFSFMLCYLSRFDIPKPLFYGVVACLCVVPMFAGYASEMVKDVSFSWAWVFFFVLFVECARTRGECLERTPYLAALLLLGLWLCLTRKTGLYIAVPSLLVLSLVIKQRRALLVGVTMGIAACMVVYSSILLPALGVSPNLFGAKGPTREAFSLVLQQTARVASFYPDDITDEERATIDKVVPVSEMQQYYDPYISDPVKERWRDPNTSELIAYLRTWAQIGMRHPVTYAGAMFMTSKDLFVPATYFKTKNDITSKWVDGHKEYFYNGGDAEADSKMLDGMKQWPALDPIRQVSNTYEYVVCSYTPVRVLFSMSLLTLWLPLLIALFLYAARRKVFHRMGLVALVPLALIALTLIAGPIVMPRYCLPSAFVFPLVLMMPFVFSRKNA